MGYITTLHPTEAFANGVRVGELWSWDICSTPTPDPFHNGKILQICSCYSHQNMSYTAIPSKNELCSRCLHNPHPQLTHPKPDLGSYTNLHLNYSKQQRMASDQNQLDNTDLSKTATSKENQYYTLGSQVGPPDHLQPEHALIWPTDDLSSHLNEMALFHLCLATTLIRKSKLKKNWPAELNTWESLTYVLISQ